MGPQADTHGANQRPVGHAAGRVVGADDAGDKLLAVDAVNDAIAYAVGTKLLKAGLHPLAEDVANLDLETTEILKKTKENHA